MKPLTKAQEAKLDRFCLALSAHHEAGHIVAAEAVGYDLDIDEATIEPGEGMRTSMSRINSCANGSIGTGGTSRSSHAPFCGAERSMFVT